MIEDSYPRISFKKRIEGIQEEIKSLGQCVLESHRNMLCLLEDYNEEKAKAVSEKALEIDKADFDLERKCIRFIATEQPVAGDLLYIESTIRVGSHLKRIGYLASNIADAIQDTTEANIPEKITNDLQYMGDYVQLMLSKAINSFLDQNITMAKELRKDDDKVDDLFDSILGQLTDFLSEDQKSIPATIKLIFIARFLERIADRAVSIGGRTIFMLTLKKPSLPA
jgi:phosphate transport system protein